MTTNTDLSDVVIGVGGPLAVVGMPVRVVKKAPDNTLWVCPGFVSAVDTTAAPDNGVSAVGIVEMQISAPSRSPLNNGSTPYYIFAADAPGGAFAWQSGSSLNVSSFTDGQFCMASQARTS